MSNTFYTSLTGLFAASYGLQNTSNNVANMQNPGFKRKDLLYGSIGNGASVDSLGAGVRISGSSINFSAGHYLETSNTSDLAIVGQGFFIIRLKNNELLYTRNGEFRFNTDGLLEDPHNYGLVQGYNAQGHLVAIQQSGPKTVPGKATHYVDLTGEFVLIEKKQDDSPQPPDPNPIKSKYENIHFTVDNLFDKNGKEHQITLEFTAKETVTTQDFLEGLEWELVKARCDQTDLMIEPQSIKFSSQSDGSAEEGANSIRLKLNDDQLVTLKWGDYMQDKDKSVRLNKQDTTHANTVINTYQHDGYGEGTQISFAFDDNGQILYQYDNGQSSEGLVIALAKFDDMEHDLQQTNEHFFRAINEQAQQIGQANKDGFGSIQSQKLESSNVDSTTEFANIVLLQRLFQSCSQLIEIDKQLLEELCHR